MEWTGAETVTGADLTVAGPVPVSGLTGARPESEADWTGAEMVTEGDWTGAKLESEVDWIGAKTLTGAYLTGAPQENEPDWTGAEWGTGSGWIGDDMGTVSGSTGTQTVTGTEVEAEPASETAFALLEAPPAAALGLPGWDLVCGLFGAWPVAASASGLPWEGPAAARGAEAERTGIAGEVGAEQSVCLSGRSWFWGGRNVCVWL